MSDWERWEINQGLHICLHVPQHAYFACVRASFPRLLKLRKLLARRTHPPTPKSVNRGLKGGGGQNSGGCVPAKAAGRFSGPWTG